MPRHGRPAHDARPVLLLLACVPLLGAAGDALAWGSAGHRVACEIAYQEMKPATRRRVIELLAGDETRPHRFSTACARADWRRNEPDAAGAPYRHHVDVPLGARRVEMARDCPPRARCVVAGIVWYTHVLSGSDDAPGRLAALEHLIHLVGDVHQPLHVGFSEDAGGNGHPVRFLGSTHTGSGRRRPMTLHAVWDTEMIEAAGITWENAEGRAFRLHRRITEEQRRAWSVLDPLAWANESLEITRRYAYAGGRNLGRRYLRENLPRAESRLQQAGVRLARLLEKVFEGDTPFWVRSRRSDVYHRMSCPMIELIESADIRIHPTPPEGRTLHSRCGP